MSIFSFSLHDALPIYSADRESLMYGWIGAGERRLAQAGEAEGADPSEHASEPVEFIGGPINIGDLPAGKGVTIRFRSEEHTSELQSPCNLVCRLLLEK